MNKTDPKQSRLIPISKTEGPYRSLAAAGWLGGVVRFEGHRRYTAMDNKAHARLQIVGHSKGSGAEIELRELWDTEKGRNMERVISVTLDPENLRAVHALLGQMIEAADAAVQERAS